MFLLVSLIPTNVSGMMERISLLLAAGWVALVMWRFRREATRAGIGGG
jgi:hypothetical protein